MRAVQSSDYALPEFKALWKLVMVHGRWNYVRISEMILYFFYKNIIFSIPQIVYTYFNGYSGQSVYDDFYITTYNLAFTNLPLLFRAVLDKDLYYKRFCQIGNSEVVHFDTVVKEYYPFLYYVGQQGTIFSPKNLILWLLEGMVQGAALLLFVLFVLDRE